MFIEFPDAIDYSCIDELAQITDPSLNDEGLNPTFVNFDFFIFILTALNSDILTSQSNTRSELTSRLKLLDNYYIYI